MTSEKMPRSGAPYTHEVNGLVPLELGNGLVVYYRQVPRVRQKNVYLRLANDGTLTVSTPWDCSIRKVEEFIRQKRGWILKHLHRQSELGRHNPSVWRPGCRLWYLGRSYPVDRREAKRNRLLWNEERFLFECADETRFETVQHAFYKRAAQMHIPGRVELWSRRMGLEPRNVAVRRYKSRWGCCTARNELIFNTRLMRYDEELIDYVVVHELAHIPHKHHGPEFWKLVERYVPNWRELRKRLV